MSSQTKRFIAVCFFVLIAMAAIVLQRSATGMAAPGDVDPPAAQEGGAPKAPAQAGAAATDKKETKKGAFDAGQKQAEADRKSAGCVTCHTYDKQMEPASMHPFGPDNIGCADCHGGNFEVTRPEGTDRGNKTFEEAKNKAHVQPKYPDIWERNGKRSAANPEISWTALNKESLEFVQFINPGDLRVASRTCGTSGCHEKEVENVDTSMMKHGAMLWEAALYNNGDFNKKNARFGESYTQAGQPERLYPVDPVKDGEAWNKMMLHGQVPYLDPLPRWEISQPGNILRVFEHGEDRLSLRGYGTGNRTDPVFLGLQKTRLLDPTLNFLGTNDQPGDYRSSGCTACHVVYANDRQKSHGAPIALDKNLRSDFANRGVTKSTDPMINNAETASESGHPVRHVLTNNIPSSNCMVCHMHPGTNMVATYYGMIWWDNETDGDQMYPEKSFKYSDAKIQEINNHNPEESAHRGKWGDREFLAEVGAPGGEINKNLKHTQFGDFHGHGWVYRAVFKVDRHGNYLDHNGNVIPKVDGESLGQAMTPDVDPQTGLPIHKDGQPVHMQDIHLEMGMQCVDCHFSGDGHGNGNLYTEVRAAIEIDCVDCHGSITDYAKLTTSGPGAETVKGKRGRNLKQMKTKFRMEDGKTREITIFQALTKDFKPGDRLPNGKVTNVPLAKGDIIQNSYTDYNKWWRVKQTKDTVIKSAAHPDDYSELSAYAKTVQVDNKTWGDNNAGDEKIAHPDSKMTCFACHTSWTTSCFGCHLPMRAPKKQNAIHNEGGPSRNWTNYNFQTLRDDVYMLGRDGTVTGNRIAPIRSSCAILVGSQSINREWLYSQQQTISAEGYSGQAFSSYVPHTVRGKGETKQCESCHVNQTNDNNAVMAQLTLQGTNAANFIGRLAYVAVGGDGVQAIAVTERDEPQAVFGSTLQKMAFPEDYKKFEKGGRELGEEHGHETRGDAQSIQQRGEYLYVANGKAGIKVYDISRVDDKLFSERISTSIVSPLGQRFGIDTKDATSISAPTTLGVDPTATVLQLTGKPLSEHYRKHDPENGEAFYRISAADANKARLARIAGQPMPEIGYDPQPIAPLYAFLYVTDRQEGLIMILAATLLDGDPENNFLHRSTFTDGADHWNPSGLLDGATNISYGGNYAYVTTPKGVVVLDISDFKYDAEKNEFHPNPRHVATIPVNDPRSVAIQFRYGFVTAADGLHVFDITDPEKPTLVEGAFVPMADAHNIYISRTYAFIAAGSQGLAIVDVESPTQPKAFSWLPGLFFTADGQISDARDVKVGMTNNSLFAYVADGKNGLKVLQLTSHEDTPGYYGYAPPLTPKLIAWKHTNGPALAISEGIDRDRAVDESGNQLTVFGRRGARPFNLKEMRQLYISSVTGQPYTVTNTPPGPPVAASPAPEEDRAEAQDDDAPDATAVASRPAAFDLMPLLLPMGLLLRWPRRRHGAGRRK